MQKSLKTSNKEEDEQLELLQSKTWLNFVLLPEDSWLQDAPQNYNRFKAINQTFIANMPYKQKKTEY